jgi:hypothetical protein
MAIALPKLRWGWCFSTLDFWVAECVKHFESAAVALESLDGFRYLIELRESKWLIKPKV